MTDLDAAFNMSLRPTSVPSNTNQMYGSAVAAVSGVPDTQMASAAGTPRIVPQQLYPQQQPQQQPPPQQQQPLPPPPPQPKIIEHLSYIDSLVSKKKDLGRLIIFAFTIVFAIAIHAFVQFALKEVSLSQMLTFKQELGIRLIYPVFAFFLIWMIKASYK